MTQRQKWLVACLTVKQHKDWVRVPGFLFFIRTTVWPPALTSSTVAGVCQRGGVRCGNRSLSQQHHCDRGHRAGHHRRPGPWCRSGSGRDVPAEEEENRWVLKNPEHWLRWRELVLRCSGLCGRLITARSDCVPTAIIENRLSTLLSRSRMSSARELSPTGDYRRGMTPEGGKCLNWTIRIRY